MGSENLLSLVVVSREESVSACTGLIDPGFVHHRRIETILGGRGMKYVDEFIQQLPALHEWQKRVRIDHIYTRVMLDWCKASDVNSLGALLASRQ